MSHDVEKLYNAVVACTSNLTCLEFVLCRQIESFPTFQGKTILQFTFMYVCQAKGMELYVHYPWH